MLGVGLETDVACLLAKATDRPWVIASSEIDGQGWRFFQTSVVSMVFPCQSSNSSGESGQDTFTIDNKHARKPVVRTHP